MQPESSGKQYVALFTSQNNQKVAKVSTPSKMLNVLITT